MALSTFTRPLGLLITLIAAGSLLAGGASHAGEVKAGVRTAAIWTDNVFGSAFEEESDASLRISPRMQVIDRDGAVTWELRVAPSYEYYDTFRSLRGWDHDVDATVKWAVTPKTELSFSNRFDRFRSLRRLNELDPATATVDSFERRERFTRNLALFTANHRLSQRHSLGARVQHFTLDFSDEDRVDFEVASAALIYSYVYSANTTVGFEASWRSRALERDSSARLSEIDQQTDFYTLSLTWSQVLDRLWRFRVVAGPAVVEGASPFQPPTGIETARLRVPLVNSSSGPQTIDTTTCPVLDDGRRFLGAGCAPGIPYVGFLAASFPQGVALLPFSGAVPDNDATTTFFADVEVSRTFQNGRAALSYRRDEDQSTATGSSGVSSSYTFTVVYKPAPKWRLNFLATYQVREQLVEQVITVTTIQPLVPAVPAFGSRSVGLAPLLTDRDDKVETIRVNAEAEYQFNERTRAQLRLLYYDQEQSTGAAAILETDRFSVWLGLTYDFEPIHF